MTHGDVLAYECFGTLATRNVTIAVELSASNGASMASAGLAKAGHGLLVTPEWSHRKIPLPDSFVGHNLRAAQFSGKYLGAARVDGVVLIRNIRIISYAQRLVETILPDAAA